MIPYDLDPTLHASQPKEPTLADGFTRPSLQEETLGEAAVAPVAEAPGPALREKSPF